MTDVWVSSGQVTLFFLYSILFGVCAGAFYDLFRILRIARKPKERTKEAGRVLMLGDDILCFVSDMIYWLVLAAAYSIFIYREAEGRLRIGSLLCAAAGFLCWHFTIGRLIIFLADRIIRLIRLIFGFVLSVTLVPLLRLLRFIGQRLCALFSAVFGRVYHRFAVKRELSLASRGFGIEKSKRDKKQVRFFAEKKGRTNK